MKLCQYVGGVCVRCGHRTAISGLRRQCGQATSPASVGVLAKARNFVAAVAGPGTELKKLLAGWPFYITASPDCSCNRVAAEMDAWGPDECEKPERINYVVEAMKANAAARGLPFVDAAGRFLVKRAIRNARRAAK